MGLRNGTNDGFLVIGLNVGEEDDAIALAKFSDVALKYIILLSH